jgi:hypothetical protein
MPSNLKKLILARRERTGEKHQTAHRHVRQHQPPTGFEGVVLRIVRLAKERNTEYESQRDPGGSYLVSTQEIMRWRDAPHPCEDALKSAVAALSERDLGKLRTLMYYGRDALDYSEDDTDDIHTVHHHLPRDKHEVKALMVVQKMPLDEYLEAGLARAKRKGVELDADF